MFKYLPFTEFWLSPYEFIRIIKEKGKALINKELSLIEDEKLKKAIIEKIEKINNGERDLYF